MDEGQFEFLLERAACPHGFALDVPEEDGDGPSFLANRRNFLGDLANEAAGKVGLDAMKDALRAIAGKVDSCGHAHLSTLHDVGRMMKFASAVWAGREPHEVLEEM